MKIGMISAWNTDSGASIHAELVGREWVRLGHQLKVFTFYDYAFHGSQITAEDEDYIVRCFTVSGYKPNELNPIPILTSDCEIFVVQDLGMLPNDLLGKIYWMIKQKSKTVNVIHDGELSTNPSFYQFEWDGIVCFDERYKNFIARAYNIDKIHIIPYPCFPINYGNKREKREKLLLPDDRKIIFSFGPAARHIIELYPCIDELSKEYPVLLLINTTDERSVQFFKEKSREVKFKIEIREKVLDSNQLYDYLHASDLLLYNKKSADHIVVASTIFQCLGSGCPIVARDSNYVEFFDKEVLKYKDFDEFKEKVKVVFNEGKEFKEVERYAEEYVKKNSGTEVAKKFINLFEEIKRGNNV